MASKQNFIADKCPHLIPEWHPTLNGKHTPFDVKYRSHIHRWWRCSKCFNHVWEASPGARSRGNGCPYCANKKVSPENCIATINPHLIIEWHIAKNGKHTPFTIIAGSSKNRWWQCSKCVNHVWETSPQHRSEGNGCPYCANQKVSPENCIAAINPHLIIEWHIAKNGKHTPYTIIAGSNTNRCWKCSKCGGEWKTSPHHRSRGNGCPYCANKKVSPANCIAAINPHLIPEWHQTLNGKHTPYTIIAGSNTPRWWQCSKCNGVWEASPNTRSFSYSNCPSCYKSRYTTQEKVREILEENLGVSLPSNKKLDWNRNPETGRYLELDGYISNKLYLNGKIYKGLAFEFDGIQHEKLIPFMHINEKGFKNNKYRDKIKDFNCSQNSVLLIRIKESDFNRSEEDVSDFVLRTLNDLGISKKIF